MKSERVFLLKKYQKLSLIINLKALKKEEYVKCILNKIDIAKTLFIIEI